MRYIPNSPEERRSMLAEIGCEQIDDLFDQIPAHLRLTTPLGIGPAINEPDLIGYFRALASKNSADYISFLGAGSYSHHIPVIVDSIISRAEFFTAYTPYQPELSQGTLQYIFEFQTMICQLTGMDVANASLYDGSTGLGEAVLMANRIKGRNRFLLSRTIHPQYREVVAASTRNLGLELEYAPYGEDGRLDLEAARLDQETAAIVVQSPNFFGCVEDLEAISDAARSIGALLIVSLTEPLSLGVLKPPGALGADIVVAEGQSFGVPQSFGGPYLGLFATREEFVRQMPGRLVGEAYDGNGRRGFVLTLSTREQHIRRERATSNICTNQGLCALMASVYLSALGRKGIQEAARQNLSKSHFTASRIAEIEGFELRFESPFFNEFVIRTPGRAAEVTEHLLKDRIIGGVALECYYPELADSLLLCVTETTSRSSIERLVESMARLRTE